MRPLRIWLTYLAVVFAGGALVAPWVYWLMGALAERFPALAGLAENPFHRFVNRSLLVLALAGLWPVLRALGVRSWRELGWVSPRGRGKELLLGFLAGLLSLAVIAVAAWAAGVRTLRPELALSDLAGHALRAGAAAVVVGVLEETLFRGGVFGTFRRTSGLAVALGFSSAVYAIVHFFARVRWEDPIAWHTGFSVLGRMLEGFANFDTLIPGFFNLALAGGLLALVFDRTGSLYGSVGLHAGWIFWLKSYNWLLEPGAGANVRFWGTDRLVDGWLALGVLAATAVVVHRELARQRPDARAARTLIR